MSRTQKLAEIKRKLKGLGVTINYQREWEQYRINEWNGTEDTATYENDIESAIDTALAIAKRING